MRTHRWMLRACGGVAASLFVSGTAASAATFVGLGDFAGGDNRSSVRGMSDDGQVVVGLGRIPGSTRGFVWHADSPGGGAGLVELPPLDRNFSQGIGVSGDGTMAVGDTFRPDGSVAGVRWALPGIGTVPPTLLGEVGTLPGSLDNSAARGASSDGSVVVGFSFSSGPGGVPANFQQAYRWTAGSGIQGLGDLPGGSAFSHAQAVSADGGTIVGRSSSSASGSVDSEAFRWRSGDGMTGLGDFSGGAFRSEARAVSGDGSVIVGYGTSAAGSEAFRWTFAGGFERLANAPSGVTPTRAEDVTNDGSVVVGSLDRGNSSEAMVWSFSDGPRAIQDLLNDAGLGTALTGWTLSSAIAVSEDGLTFAGNGVNPSGDPEAWWATLAGAAALAGDFSGDGGVEQADLDLVLTNWGGPRGDWANADGFATPTVDQEELDAVLTGWGGAAAPSFDGATVPEPGLAALVGLGFVLTRRRGA